MPDVQLTCTTTVLTFAGLSPDADLVKFVSPADPGDDPIRQYVLTLEGHLWRDMASPIEITVSIKPGDKLNDARSLHDSLLAACQCDVEDVDPGQPSLDFFEAESLQAPTPTDDDYVATFGTDG
jgi:hypothetical protein